MVCAVQYLVLKIGNAPIVKLVLCVQNVSPPAIRLSSIPVAHKHKGARFKKLGGTLVCLYSEGESTT